MSTDKLRVSNRRNSLASTGPITERGRARVRSNALKHGFYCLVSLTAIEDGDDYSGLLDDYLADYQPAGAAETELVQRLVKDLWKARRLESVECALLDDARERFLPKPNEYKPNCRQYAGASALAGYLAEQSGLFNVCPLERLNALSSRLQNSINRTMSMLRSLQSDRLHSEARAASAEASAKAEQRALAAATNPPQPAASAPQPSAPTPPSQTPPKTKPPKNVIPSTPSIQMPNPEIGFVPHNPIPEAPANPDPPHRAA